MGIDARQLYVNLAHLRLAVVEVGVVELGEARLHVREVAELDEGDAAGLGGGFLLGEQAHAGGLEGGEVRVDVVGCGCIGEVSWSGIWGQRASCGVQVV